MQMSFFIFYLKEILFLKYIFEHGEVSDRDEFFNLIDTQVSPEVGETIMSLAVQLREEGLSESE